MKIHSHRVKSGWCTLVFITLAFFCFTIGCTKQPQNAKDVLEANLDATGGKENWEEVQSVVENAEIVVEIDGKDVSKSNTISKVEMPEYKKIEAYTSNNLSRIELMRPEEAYFVSFDKGNFTGISKIEKRQVQIKPELKLLEDFEDWNFETVSWNGSEVYQLQNSDTGEKLLYDPKSFRRIAKITSSPYGEATTLYTNFKENEGLEFPYEEKQSIPASKYETLKKIQTIEINSEFSPNEFELDENWVTLQVGDSVPDFELNLRGGESQKISRKGLLGKVVLIDFWATWCKPCIKEFPNLKEQYEKYQDQDFEILSISLDENKVALDNFLKNNTFPWKNAHLQEGFKSDLVKRFHIAVIPKPILVDREGTIIAIDEEASGENLNQKLSEIFNDNI